MQVAGSPFAAFRATPAATVSTRQNSATFSNASPQVQFGRDEDTVLATAMHSKITQLARINQLVTQAQEALAHKHFEPERIMTKFQGNYNQILEQLQNVKCTSIKKQTGLIEDALHDLNNPNAVIKATIDLNSERDTDPSRVDNLYKPALERITEIANLYTTLLRSTLDADSSPNNICNIVADSLRPQAERKRIKLRVSMRKHNRSPIGMSPYHLLALMHLLTENAIKYTPEGGRVNIELKSKMGELKFVVQDSGIGIPTGDLNKIFDGERGSNTGGIIGTGYGLRRAKALVQESGGSLIPLSPLYHNRKEPYGTQMTVTLPVAPVANRRNAEVLKLRELVYA